jgi:hypothetical protein
MWLLSMLGIKRFLTFNVSDDLDTAELDLTTF